jgi:hypothetical protein
MDQTAFEKKFNDYFENEMRLNLPKLLLLFRLESGGCQFFP